MVYLMENEAGWDLEAIGYPSIAGCIAICISTPQGLFGLHNAGGSGRAQFQNRADRFLAFVQAWMNGRTPIVQHLYGATFVGNNQRGYTVGQARTEWRAEMEVFAANFNYAGPISGCDLSNWMPAGTDISAYVEYTALGMGCSIAVKQWKDNEANKVTTANPNTPTMQRMIGAQNNQMVTSVNRAGLITVVPEVIRG